MENQNELELESSRFQFQKTTSLKPLRNHLTLPYPTLILTNYSLKNALTQYIARVTQTRRQHIRYVQLKAARLKLSQNVQKLQTLQKPHFCIIEIQSFFAVNLHQLKSQIFKYLFIFKSAALFNYYEVLFSAHFTCTHLGIFVAKIPPNVRIQEGDFYGKIETSLETKTTQVIHQ
ncbi:hypothetical protein SS50377_27296 [Spironucleus salmonicida]|uniref:Uncharacterized protein n=1 Tax=Spironucleus salmonicida TaxID=348837 RepID=V6LTD5_9EUKA|nr:hypothetical protein SS50377_28828 [Spironucleus salmonicida]KAH0571002.1 hypothetical protein SS50377_27296 [Spironucleus salmonicida]|eukprot:EST46956.1 Hypothetical protein SS50377_12990 [Spironucleus salmonicida]